MADPDEPEELQNPGPDTDEGVGNDEDAIEPMPASIRFSRKGLDNNLLVLTVEPDEDLFAGIAVREIENWIRRQDCADWFLHEETIRQVSRETRRLDKVKEYVVAERRDCRIDIQISSDRLQAWIRVSPAYGGTPVTEDLIRQALQEHQIKFGIHESLVQQIIHDGECERQLIAEGTPPKPGQPVKFEPLVHESEHKGVPQEREYGRVDYKDLGLFLSVKEGTPLLRHIPPTEGSPGIGVDGMPISAPPAVDRAPHPGIGTAFSKEDPEVIVATRAGQPYFFENSVRVDPILEIDAVGPSTGNVRFEGNIIVRGPVESGYEVSAGQDLTILDTVEGARLTAGRNLNLLTGVYGKGKSVIIAAGNIEARFLSDCQIRCGGNMEVADLINHCNVECEGFIYIGKSGGKGQAFGGRLVAMRGIQARILGSVSETATQVELAPPQALLLRLSKAEEEMDAARKAFEITEKNLQAAKDAHPNRDDPHQKSLEEKLSALRDKLDSLRSEIAALEEKVNAPRKGKIKADEVHRGVTLRIGKGREIVSDLINDLCYQEPAEKKPREESNREDAKDAKKRKE